MMGTVTFPGLGLEFHLDRVAFQLFGLPIYWYGVIIACGFLLAVVFCYKMAPRFGVKPEKVLEFAEEMKRFQNLVFKGISTHPGHVYGAACEADVPKYCEDERKSVALAADALRNAGYALEIVSSGSTPTFWGALDDENIQIYHPGNYIFNDAIQLSTNTATEDECALYVLASVISHPSEDLYICDAGAKCLGLDQGAHGNTSIKGFGVVKGHPELTVYSLSEEVGKFHVEGKTDLKVGDKVVSGKDADIKPGNALPLKNIPVGTFIHNVELYPGKGAQLARAAGIMAQLMAKENGMALLRLPSGELRNVPETCMASIGQVSNIDHENVKIGKAGRKRHMGWRPTVRGSVMNPNDHPHGGGEGKSPIGHPGPMTPWGKPALGYKTRAHHNRSDKFIVKRRNGK